MSEFVPSGNRPFLSRHMLAGTALAGLLGTAMLFPAFAADGPAMPWAPPSAPTFADDPADPNGPPPKLMLPSNQGWSGRSAADAGNYTLSRTTNEWAPPLTGIGPISDGPDYPFYNNGVARIVGYNSSYRVADLTSEAAKNLMPWAIEALKEQNVLTLEGQNGETRQARCWEVGVPDIHEAPFAWHFIQTPKVVVIIQSGARQAVRHVYMDVPHSENPKPSWYGESVGHYEGDTLVVDTIGLNTETFVDGFRTPHTEQLHVVERFRVVDGGKAVDISWTADDPGLAYQSWGARKPRYLQEGRMREDQCAAANQDRFNRGVDPVPRAEIPDF